MGNHFYRRKMKNVFSTTFNNLTVQRYNDTLYFCCIIKFKLIIMQNYIHLVSTAGLQAHAVHAIIYSSYYNITRNR